MYKIILMDADDTLFDFEKAETHALKETLKHFDCNIEFNKIQKIYRKINTQLWIDLEHELITKNELKTKRFSMLFEHFNLKYDPIKFGNYYLLKLGEGSFLFEDTINVCEYLYKKYTLVIVTNGIKDVQLSRFKKSAINQYITDIIISDDIGISKPDPKIFEYALKKLNHHDKSSVIMVGDSLTADIAGGINFGIDTCWANLFNKENTTELKPTYEINKLTDLFEIL